MFLQRTISVILPGQNVKDKYHYGVDCFSCGTFESYFSYHLAIWIDTNDFYMYFYLIVLAPFITLLQLINGSIINFTEILIPPCDLKS